MALIDPFVNIPSTGRPLSFDTDSENFFNVQFPLKVSEISAAAVAMNLNSTNSTSTTSMLIGAGAKTLTVQTNKSYVPGMNIVPAVTASPSTNFVNAKVDSYVAATGVLNFTVQTGDFGGTGTFAAWTISQGPAGGATTAFVNQAAQNQSSTAFITTGTSSAYILTPSPALTALATNQRFNVTFHAAPTGSPTVAISGLAVKNLKYYDAAGVKQFINSTVTPLNWNSDVIYDGVDWMVQTILPTAINSKIQPITASVATNALTITVNPTTLDFRSATLGSGAISTLTLTATASLVIPSTATLGTVSAIQSRLVVLLINNAGALETAVVNIAGGTDLSETGIISTTAIAAASNSASVVYSAVARTGVAYRVVGYVESTQATAGTWATAPSTIQGVGGQALVALSSLGFGQTWQTVTGSRAAATTYYNTTGKPIQLSINISTATANGNNGTLTINGVAVVNIGQANNAAVSLPLIGIVPSGGSYSLTVAGATLSTWYELR